MDAYLSFNERHAIDFADSSNRLTSRETMMQLPREKNVRQSHANHPHVYIPSNSSEMKAELFIDRRRSSDFFPFSLEMTGRLASQLRQMTLVDSLSTYGDLIYSADTIRECSKKKSRKSV